MNLADLRRPLRAAMIFPSTRKLWDRYPGAVEYQYLFLAWLINDKI
jgi:hypothetical protein